MSAALIIAIGAAVISLLTVVYNIRLRQRLLGRARAAEQAARLAKGKLAEMEERLGGPPPVNMAEATGLDRLDPRPPPRLGAGGAGR